MKEDEKEDFLLSPPVTLSPKTDEEEIMGVLLDMNIEEDLGKMRSIIEDYCNDYLIHIDSRNRMRYIRKDPSFFRIDFLGRSLCSGLTSKRGQYSTCLSLKRKVARVYAAQQSIADLKLRLERTNEFWSKAEGILGQAVSKTNTERMKRDKRQAMIAYFQAAVDLQRNEAICFLFKKETQFLFSDLNRGRGIDLALIIYDYVLDFNEESELSRYSSHGKGSPKRVFVELPFGHLTPKTTGDKGAETDPMRNPADRLGSNPSRRIGVRNKSWTCSPAEARVREFWISKTNKLLEDFSIDPDHPPFKYYRGIKNIAVKLLQDRASLQEIHVRTYSGPFLRRFSAIEDGLELDLTSFASLIHQLDDSDEGDLIPVAQISKAIYDTLHNNNFYVNVREIASQALADSNKDLADAIRDYRSLPVYEQPKAENFLTGLKISFMLRNACWSVLYDKSGLYFLAQVNISKDLDPRTILLREATHSSGPSAYCFLRP